MEFSFNYAKFSHFNLLSKNDQMLVDAAFEAMNKAYAPYSEFRVGASVLLGNGLVVLGNNQENLAYPSGLCAERVALFYAGANYPNEVIDTICIVAKGTLVSKELLLSPCGSCRQVMIESSMRQSTPIRIIMVNQDNRTLVINKVEDLLPFAFSK